MVFDAYLKWDGVCIPAQDITSLSVPQAAALWCNSRDIGEGLDKAPEPEPSSGLKVPHGKKSKPLVVSSQKAEITVVSMTPVFAPAQEYALVRVNIKNVSGIGSLIFQVYDGTKLVYAERLTRKQVFGLPTTVDAAQAKKPALFVKGDESADARKVIDDKRAAFGWANPHGTYTAIVMACTTRRATPNEAKGLPRIDLKIGTTLEVEKGVWRNTAPKGPNGARIDQTSVRYHSMELGLGEWLPAPTVTALQAHADQAGGPTHDFATADVADPKIVEWTWYKLATLGFFPGPRVIARGTNDLLGKAIRRYRRAHSKMYEPLYKDDEGNISFDNDANNKATQIDKVLLAALYTNDNDRVSGADTAKVLPAPVVITDKGQASKLFVDVDRFYIDNAKEFEGKAAGNGKSAVDREWVLRPQLALQTTVHLKNAAGEKATHVPAGALGPFKVKWTWSDTAMDTGGLPVFSETEPSLTKEYVDKAVLAAKAAVPSTFNNARALVGGLVKGTDDDASAPFEAHLPVAAGSATPTGFVSQASTRGAGVSAVTFRPSTVAGDNYVVKAAIDTAAWTPAMTQRHTAVQGQLQAETGKIEIWRRVTIAAYAKWGTVTEPTWTEVFAKFESAFTQFVAPQKSLTIGGLPPGAKKILSDRLDAYFKAQNYIEQDEAKNREHAMFSPDFLVPYDARSAEFRQIAALGKAQFEHVNNIVNELMVTSLTAAMDVWRNTPTKGAGNAKTALASRLAAARAWATGAGWVKAVGDHFVAEIGKLYDGTNLKVVKAAQKVLAPIPSGSMGGAPPTRISVLQALFLAPVTALIDTWKTGGTPALANFNTMRTLIGQVRKDLAEGDRADPQVPANPVLVRSLEHIMDIFESTVGSVVKATFALHTHQLEVITHDDAAADRLVDILKAPPHSVPATSIERVSKAHVRVIRARDVADIATFDPSAFKTTHADVHSVRLVRATALEIPKLAMTPEDEDVLDLSHRYAVNVYERRRVLTTMGSLSGTLLPQVFGPTDRALRFKDPGYDRPAGGLLVVHYAAHVRPCAIETGAVNDIADMTNSTSMGGDGGLTFVSKDQPVNAVQLFAHEMGHNLFLRHWQNGVEGVGPGSQVADHDFADNNCIMTYPSIERPEVCESHYAIPKFKPHFCGRCNLKLRGWEIEAIDPKTTKQLLPISSIDLKYIDPTMTLPTMTPPQIPDLDELTAQVHELLGQLAVDPSVLTQAFPVDGDKQVFVGNPKKVTKNGKTYFEWENLGAKHGAKTLAKGTKTHINKGEPEVLDADIPYKLTLSDKPAWEAELEFVLTLGGSTNTPSEIVYNTHCKALFDGTMPIHELIHVYQKWNKSRLDEGITELFALMLAAKLLALHPGEKATFTLAVNPTYMTVTQFAMDELLPRLGLGGLAKLYFEEKEDLLHSVLRQRTLQDNKRLVLFHEACTRGIRDYDMREAAAMLLPLAECPPALTKLDDPLKYPNKKTPEVLLAEGREMLDTFMTENNRLDLGPTQRALHARVLRVDAKKAVYADAVAEAKKFRPQLTKDTRIHRLESFIEETEEQVRDLAALVPPV